MLLDMDYPCNKFYETLEGSHALVHDEIKNAIVCVCFQTDNKAEPSKIYVRTRLMSYPIPLSMTSTDTKSYLKSSPKFYIQTITSVLRLLNTISGIQDRWSVGPEGS